MDLRSPAFFVDFYLKSISKLECSWTEMSEIGKLEFNYSNWDLNLISLKYQVNYGPLAN